MKVLCVSRNGREITRARVHSGVLLVGRSPSCDVVLRAKGAKAVHCIIEWMGEGRPVGAAGQWSITDAAISGAASGSIIGETPIVVGGFEFSWKEDRLAATALHGKILSETFLERNRAAGASSESAEAPYQPEYQLQVVSIRNDSGSVVEVSHLLRPKKTKKSICLPEAPDLRLNWGARSTETSVTVDFARLRGAKVFRKGTELTSVGMNAPVTTRLSPGDFIQIQDSAQHRDHYLRLVPKIDVPHVKLSVLEDPYYRNTAIGLLLAILFITAMSTQNFSIVEAPMEPPRIAKIEIKELIPPRPPRSEAKPPPTEAPSKAAAPKNTHSEVKNPSPGLDSPSPKANINSVGLLGAIKKDSGQVKADQLINDAIVSHTVSGDQAHFVVKQPPSGTLARKTRTSSEELSAAYTRLNAKDSLSGKAGGPVVTSEGKGSGWVADYSNSSNSGASSDSDPDFSTEGGLDKISVRNALAAYRKDIRTCYERALATKPSIRGRILYKWSIAPAGAVNTVNLMSSSVESPSLGSCVQNVIKTIRFPKAARPTLVIYPFEFQTKK